MPVGHRADGMTMTRTLFAWRRFLPMQGSAAGLNAMPTGVDDYGNVGEQESVWLRDWCAEVLSRHRRFHRRHRLHHLHHLLLNRQQRQHNDHDGLFQF